MRFANGLRLALVAVAVWACWSAVQRRPPRNLILISIDTLRADHLGAWGYPRPTSPYLDRLAARSVRFTQAVAQAPNTPPSHASLLTSLYYSAHGFTGNGDRLPSWAPTLAEILRRAGFATWGFVDGGYLVHDFGFDRGFEHFEDQRRHIAGILPRVERWLDAHPASRFFLFIHCYDVHSPYAPPLPFRTMFEEQQYRGNFEPTNKNLKSVVDHERSLTPEDLRHVVARYDGGIRYTDEQLGGFFAELERRGLSEETLVVVVADHGEEFLEHGSMLHWQTWFSPNLHVPLIMSVPGLPPRTIDGPVELIDVLPTVLELLGLPPHPLAMGRSLVPLLEGRERPGERIAYAEPFLPTVPLRTAVSAQYQLFFDVRTGGSKLFDVAADPHATTDLSASRPDVAAALRAQIDAVDRRVAAVRNQFVEAPAPPAEMRPAVRKQLRALGYLEE